ncbi:hypothetical protein PVIIG_05543 [Plasmodium vivax India VII]|uniref:Uncharacterized protein n=1 Tax=Plasmodium vivax India VII TaxID=1077284 RepID=A0A0J9SGE5_PLAVI|nr:hypothetical protein PVIIG_05543 [Plasmodium vivax India VII]
MSYRTKYNFVNLCGQRKNEINNYPKETTDINDPLCNRIKEQYETCIDFKNKYTCQQVMYIFNSISSSPTSEFNDDRCKYLYYWIYQELLQKNKNYDVALKVYRSILGKYFENYDEDDNHLRKNYIHEDKDMILKNSAKLIELYDTMNNDGNTFDCDCAKKCSDLYKEFVGECYNDYDYAFCSELQSFKYKYDEKMKSIETCNGAEKILPCAIKHDVHVIIIIPMIILTILAFLVFVLYKVKLFG